jgi:DNA-binding CsgD family transcriptional regulator
LRQGDVLDLLPRLAELAPKVGSLRVQAFTQFVLTLGCDAVQGEQHIATALRLAERVRDRALLCLSLSRRSAHEVADGRWAAARESMDRAIAIYPRITYGAVYARRARVEYEVGDVEAGDAFLDRYLQAYRAGEGESIFEYSFLAELISRRAHTIGRWEHEEVAREITASILSSPRASPANRLVSLRWTGLLAAVTGRKEGARRALAGLRDFRHCHGGTAEDSVDGVVAAGGGEPDLAEQWFTKATDALRRPGSSRPDLAWACFDHADFLLNLRDDRVSERAGRLLSEALSVARELDMHTLESKARSLSESHGPAAAPLARLGLTPREREVLQHVALGKTNQEISRDLGISEHTVAHHVGAILRKTGVTNRVDAATYAVRCGMASH